MKIMVISDLHYPLPYSRLYAKAIRKEKPDRVVLLGDVVAPSSFRNALPLYKRFVKEYEKVFPVSRTVFLLGDNEGRIENYLINKEVANFLAGLPKANKDLITYSYKNLFFFHGNIEHSFAQERLGRKLAKLLVPIHELLLPYLLGRIVRLKFHMRKGQILLLGHIHYLGKVDHDVFCGTFCKEKILYGVRKSLGYAVISDTGKKQIDMHDIELMRLRH